MYFQEFLILFQEQVAGQKSSIFQSIKFFLLQTISNLFKDSYMGQIKENQFLKVEIFKIHGNSFTAKSCQGFYNLLTYNKQLFIYNDWNQIDNDLGLVIIQSYKLVYDKYQTKSSNIPEIFKSLKIDNSTIGDQVCILFSQQFFYFPYLKIISFRNNKNITMYGKLYIYLTLFQDVYSTFNIQEFHFDDQKFSYTVFDDGILRYQLNLIKAWFQYNKKQQIDSLGGIEKKRIVRWGIVGKWIIYLINWIISTVEQFDTQQFHLSKQFMQYIYKNDKRIKILSLIHTISHFLIILIASIAFTREMNIWIKKKLFFEEICEKSKKNGDFICFLPFSSRQSEIMELSIFLFSLLLAIPINIIDLILTIRTRKIIQADYQELNERLQNYLKKRLPHKKEIFYLILTTLVQLSYIFDFNLIFFLHEMHLWNKYESDFHKFDSSHEDIEKMSQKILKLLIGSLIFIIFKIVFQVYFDIKAMIELKKISPTESVLYLNCVWKKSQHEYNYALENFLSIFCPQQGVTIFKIYFNYKQIFELIQAFLIELPLLILYVLAILNLNEFFARELDMLTIYYPMLWLYLGTIKSLIKFIFNLIIAMTARSSFIKQQELNYVLFFRRYQFQKDQLDQMEIQLQLNKNISKRQQFQQKILVQSKESFGERLYPYFSSQKKIFLQNQISDREQHKSFSNFRSRIKNQNNKMIFWDGNECLQ